MKRDGRGRGGEIHPIRDSEGEMWAVLGLDGSNLNNGGQWEGTEGRDGKKLG